MKKAAAVKMLLLHLIALTAVVMLPVYRFLSRLLPKVLFGGCFLHDYCKLYCPLCGGTRTVEALLHWQWREALRCNALVVLSLPILAAVYLSMWIRLFRGEGCLLRVSRWFWIAAISALVVFGLLRNLLLVGFGIDPLGDLLPFWQGIE